MAFALFPASPARSCTAWLRRRLSSSHDCLDNNTKIPWQLATKKKKSKLLDPARSQKTKLHTNIISLSWGGPSFSSNSVPPKRPNTPRQSPSNSTLPATVPIRCPPQTQTIPTMSSARRVVRTKKHRRSDPPGGLGPWVPGR